jgi:hypothetical protein
MDVSQRVYSSVSGWKTDDSDAADGEPPSKFICAPEVTWIPVKIANL